MKTLNCIVVDDEPLALELLQDYIEKTPFLNLVNTFTNPIEALQLIQNQEIDLVYLDVQMPELTGIQFLKIAGDKSKYIVTTAYPEYALEGYELNVVDYLLKPFGYDRFYKASQKVLLSSSITTLAQPEIPVEDDFIFVKSELKMQKVYIHDILFIEGLKDYVSIYTKSERIITLQSMKKMEEVLLKPSFLRIHRSYIVALNKIDSIERNRIFISDKVIPIGDTYRDEFDDFVEKKNI